jgi:hypothetical protein
MIYVARATEADAARKLMWTEKEKIRREIMWTKKVIKELERQSNLPGVSKEEQEVNKVLIETLTKSLYIDERKMEIYDKKIDEEDSNENSRKDIGSSRNSSVDMERYENK